MSVDYQEDVAEGWDVAETAPGTDGLENQAKFASLNEALEQAGSVMGDMRDDLPIAFRFEWHDMTIFCRIADRDEEIVLELATDLGPVPFTIENRQRRGYLKELRRPTVDLPIGKFFATDRSRFRHSATRVLTAPITGSGIVTAVVQILLSARPYYELAKATA